WNSTNAVSCDLKENFGIFFGIIGPSGSKTLTADQNNSYQVVCSAAGATGVGGQGVAESIVNVRVNNSAGAMPSAPMNQTELTVPANFPHPTTQQITVTCNVSGVTGAVNFSWANAASGAAGASCLDITSVGSFTGLPAGSSNLNFSVASHGGKCNPD